MASLPPAIALLLAAAAGFPVQPAKASRALFEAAEKPSASESGPPVNIPIPAKIHRYARRLVQHYDANGDGQLAVDEWRSMRGNPPAADINGDGALTIQELATRVAEYGWRRNIRLVHPWRDASQENPPLVQPASGPDSEAAADAPDADSQVSGAEAAMEDASPPRDGPRGLRFFVPASRLPSGLPPWFLQRDGDGDGQLTLAEYAPLGSPAQLDDFVRYDANGDGVLTAGEYVGVEKAKGSQRPTLAEQRSVRSEPAKQPPAGEASQAAPSENVILSPRPARVPGNLMRASRGQSEATAPLAQPAKPQGGSSPGLRPDRRPQSQPSATPPRIPQASPAWFRNRDADGDGQLTRIEYSPHASEAELAHFDRLDMNRDGVVSLTEALRGSRTTGAAPRAAADERTRRTRATGRPADRANRSADDAQR